MQTRRLKSALLAGSLTTIAAAIAMTAAAPTPVAAAGAMHSEQGMSSPCGASKCGPAKQTSMHRAKKMTAGNPCGPGHSGANSSSSAANPCGPASNGGR
jgi:uncharacterized low-complexity protein